MKELKFERLGVFRYSPEEGTKAEEMPDQVPDEVKMVRYRRADGPAGGHIALNLSGAGG